MVRDLIGYDVIIEDAMRGVIRQVLKNVEKNGLLGEHYFVISFLTTEKDVKIPKKLKDKFPEEMTIVIQYQFHYLSAKEKNFIISLSFAGEFEELTIPYSAIISFADPSINFGLKFNNYDLADYEEGEALPEEPVVEKSTKKKKKKFDTSAKVISLADFKKNKDKE